MFSKSQTVIIILLLAALAFLAVTNRILTSDLKASDAKVEVISNSLSTAVTINSNLNLTIDTLNQTIDDERSAVEEMKTYNATVDAKVAQDAKAIKERLESEEDDCGSKRLPPSVIDGMWQHYRTESGDPDT